MSNTKPKKKLLENTHKMSALCIQGVCCGPTLFYITPRVRSGQVSTELQKDRKLGALPPIVVKLTLDL